MSGTRRRTPTTTAAGLVLGTEQAAATRLGAIAALHQPIERIVPASSIRGIELEPAQSYLVCGECKTHGRYSSDPPARAPWPCATARLAGPWPLLEEVSRG